MGLNVQTIILAAGKGTRMKSKYPKVIHPLCGLPMVGYVIKAVAEVTDQTPWVVVGYGADQVQQCLGEGPEFILQTEQLGTGHAVLMAKDRLEGMTGQLIVLYGDTPLITGITLNRIINAHQHARVAATVLTARLEQPFGYGRIVRDDDGQVEAIIEEKDATPEQKSINEINTGIYCFEISALLKTLPRLQPQNAQGEYYLTDVIGLLREDGEKLATLLLENPEEILGPNDRLALAKVETIMRGQILRQWMQEGVTIVDPSHTYIDSRVKILPDTRILPGTFIEGETVIGEDCVIGPDTHLIDARIGNNCSVFRSVLEQAVIENDVKVGPFAYLRPGAVVENGAKVGDFVEIKNSRIGEGSKVPHLSYIGDCTIGKDTNIGAGTITCNYDGKHKHQTVIGDHAFIGSNTNLVAPVTVGDGATIGAGSTITKNVPADSLAIERSHQFVKEGWKPPHRR